MNGRSIFSAVVVLCLLGLVALVVTMPQSESQGGWLFNRHQAISQPADAATVAAKGQGFFPHTRKTVENCEQITNAIKAGIKAAGQEVDKESTAKAAEPPASASDVPAISGYPIINSGGGYPVINRGGGRPVMSGFSLEAAAIVQRQCGPNGCQLVQVPADPPQPQEQQPQVEQQAVQGCDGSSDCCPPRRGLFGRRR